MIKKFKFIRSSLILVLVLISIFLSYIAVTSARDPLINAYAQVELKWSDELSENPVVPRGKIVELNLTIKLKITTGLRFGKGLLDAYKGTNIITRMYLEDYPYWCYANFKSDMMVTSITSEEMVVSTSLFLTISENAPAYGDGYVKVNVRVSDMGLMKGANKTFTLSFKPAYFPIIKINLPKSNAVRTNPTNLVVFPIEVENLGNSRTKVFFDIENIPKGWSATLTDSFIVAEGSKEIVYLSVAPSSGFGYHYEDALFNVKIVPTLAEDQNQIGLPIYANFIVQNRGFSSSGLEFYIPIAIIIIIVIFLLVRIIVKKRK